MSLGTHLQILKIKKTLNETIQNAVILAKKGSERQVMPRDRHETVGPHVTIHTRWFFLEKFVASVYTCLPKQRPIMLHM